MPHLLQDIELQELNCTMLEKLEKTFRKHLRRLTNTYYPTLISNNKLYKLAHANPLIRNITKQRWTLIKKMITTNNPQIDDIMVRYFTCKSKKGYRSVIKNSLPALIAKDLQLINKNFNTIEDFFNIKKIAMDKNKWKKLIQDPIQRKATIKYLQKLYYQQNKRKLALSHVN